MMGTQLYNDASVPQHHKYAAHQIALLYVSTNRTTMRACQKSEGRLMACMLYGHGKQHCIRLRL